MTPSELAKRLHLVTDMDDSQIGIAESLIAAAKDEWEDELDAECHKRQMEIYRLQSLIANLPEINPSNYSEEEVVAMNDAIIAAQRLTFIDRQGNTHDLGLYPAQPRAEAPASEEATI